MQEVRPRGMPDGTLNIDPDQGFGPHMKEEFLDFYGVDSVFVTSTVDCLTHRFLNVLIKAKKIPSDHARIQYSSNDMREALESLLEALSSRGVEKPAIALMRSAVGQDDARAFERMAGTQLGSDLLNEWFRLLERENYLGAKALLVAH